MDSKYSIKSVQEMLSSILCPRYLEKLAGNLFQGEHETFCE